MDSRGKKPKKKKQKPKVPKLRNGAMFSKQCQSNRPKQGNQQDTQC